MTGSARALSLPRHAGHRPSRRVVPPQGLPNGPAVVRFGEWRLCLCGQVTAEIVAAGYGLAGSLIAVLVLMVLRGPEGLVQQVLVAMMSRAVPEDAKGESQGGNFAAMNVATLIGTVLFSQLFGVFTQPARDVPSPDVAFYPAAALLVVGLVLYVQTVRRGADS